MKVALERIRVVNLQKINKDSSIRHREVNQKIAAFVRCELRHCTMNEMPELKKKKFPSSEPAMLLRHIGKGIWRLASCDRCP